MSLPLTIEKPRQRDSAGQFSGQGVLTAALLRKAYGRPRLAGRGIASNTLDKVPLTFNSKIKELATQLDGRLTEFGLLKKIGIGAAVLGAAALPAAAGMLRIQGRRLTPGAANHPAAGGKFVHDYIDSSQKALNSGPQGYIAGKVIEHNRNKSKVGSLDRFMADHYARFRSGPREALKHWGYEVGESLHQSSTKKGMSPAATATRMSGFNKSQTKVSDAIDQQLWHHGKNEIEAIKAVGNNPDPEIQSHFRRLAAHKTSAVKRRYGPLSIAAPALLAGGVATAAVGAHLDKKEEDKKRLARLGR